MSEKKKKVFISGPMSGIKDFNKPAFDQAEKELTEAGYSVFNPARMQLDTDVWTHENIMSIDLAALDKCDYIYMLPKWYYSKGAIQEYHYANAIGVELLGTSDMKSPMKESKPKQRIEIECYGDISGENLDFLKWVEKHCNEILAKGGNLTEGVEVQIDSTTEHILHMMALLNGHKPPKRSCSTCKHEKDSSLGDCLNCGPYENWEPKPTPEAPKKSCDMCKHYACSLGEEPCKSCKDKSNWEHAEE